MTVIDWVDVFTRPDYRYILLDSIKYCQKNKGLVIFAWCLMSNHIHLIAGAKEGFHLSNILRDFKKYTSKNIVSAIAENPTESRKKWILNRFEFAGRFDNKITDYKFWQEGNEAKEIHTNHFLDQKLDYIHNNPVKAEIVARPEDYLYSSARDYAGEKGLLEVELIN